MKLLLGTYLLILIVLTSCTSESSAVKNEETFVPDTILIPIQFQPFQDSRIPSILEEAGLCKDIPKDSLRDSINMFDPPCMANFYRVFKFNDAKDLEDIFGVTIASRVHDFPIRRTILMVKENKKWVLMNRFVGDLVEMRTSQSGYNDLIIRHPDIEAGSFAVRYVYKEGKYLPEVAEEVDDKLIRKELVDSLSPIIISRIKGNKMYQ
ncbi:MAG: hypothetical protein R2799_02320 [Crocinitomicaceae bacterium]